MDLGALLAEAAEVAARKLGRQMRPQRRGAFKTRRPGVETPLWNACAALMRAELRQHGSKVRLARYLGVPKQRLNDYLKDSSRMPDAETLLQMLDWLARKRAGQDLSL